MDCSELERLLPAFADGEFAPEDSTETEVHLATCESCRGQVQELIAFRSFVHSRCAPVQAPPSLRRDIQRKIAKQRSLENLRRYASYSAVAAGLAIVATAGYVAKEDAPTAPRPLEVVMDAVDKHARALPVEVTPAAGDVDSWFRGKVDFAVRAPVFKSPAAPRLMGARLANVRDRQAAYFVYGGDDPGRRMTLLLFPGNDLDLPDGEGAQEVMVANEKGYNVAVWRKRGIVYSLVSDLDERDILQLVSQVEER